MLQDLKWQPLADRRRDQQLILLYKIINGLVAIPADQHIQPNPRPSRNRHTKTLLIHTCNTDIYKHSFIPHSTIDWNSLPEATVTSKTVDRFKAALLKCDIPEGLLLRIELIFSNRTDTDTKLKIKSQCRKSFWFNLYKLNSCL
jgi:hypothetical protein